MICESRLICVSRQTQTETLSKPNQGVLHSIPAGFMKLMHDLFPQYYTLATSTTLFYNYLLAPSDEVCRDSSATASRFPTETTASRKLDISGPEGNHGVCAMLVLDPTFR